MQKYTAIDLFSGAGGLSLGFEAKGFNVLLAIEKDLWAKDTYNLNHKNKNCIEADITMLPDDYFLGYKDKVDVVMGGPPCQGFSIAASNRRKKNDDRNFLYRHFLRVVSLVNPKIVLIENVKEFSRYFLPSGGLLIDDVVKTLQTLGYICDYSVIDIMNYGVPQDRKRTFCIAAKENLVSTLDIKQLLAEFKQEPLNLSGVISDLPEVKPYEIKDGDILTYRCAPQNTFQGKMRKGSDGVHNHVPMQHTPRTVEKFKYILEHHDEEGLPENLKSRVRGDVQSISSSKFSQNHRIMNPDKVAPTITASFYSSFIHPYQPRNLTVREAARIQTFPDWFVFTGKKTTLSKKLLSRKGVVEDLHLDQFNQVGNAVPPMMAENLAEICRKILERKV